MIVSAIELLAGLAVAGLTLRDVFDTVIVPGNSRASLRVARRLTFVLLPLWNHRLRRRRGITTTFAPLLLVSSFVVWMVLLAIAFGLMIHALSDSFSPPPLSFAQAVYLAGTGLVTVGLGAIDVHGGGRWATLGSGFCGLAVMTMAVTYLLEVQSSIARRDSGIFKLRTSAGEPPAALALLKKYAAIGAQNELPQVLRDGRDWCATVRQSHAAHPSLIYFRSTGTGSGWPAAVGALLDLALMVELVLDAPDLRGLAVLLREDALRMAERLGAHIGLVPQPVPTDPAAMDIALEALAAAGYRVQAAPDHDAFMRCRDSYSGWVQALADHLGRSNAPLLPPEEHAEAD